MDVIDFDVQLTCDDITNSENHDHVINNDCKQSNGKARHHYVEVSKKSPNGHINGLVSTVPKHNDLTIVKSDFVAPTKEAQYASIVAVQTNPKYSGVLCKQTKQPFLKTFAPVYEENATNFAHVEYPVYATIGKPTTGMPLIKVCKYVSNHHRRTIRNQVFLLAEARAL